jgi:hypothetical protein
MKTINCIRFVVYYQYHSRVSFHTLLQLYNILHLRETGERLDGSLCRVFELCNYSKYKLLKMRWWIVPTFGYCQLPPGLWDTQSICVLCELWCVASPYTLCPMFLSGWWQITAHFQSCLPSKWSSRPIPKLLEFQCLLYLM